MVLFDFYYIITLDKANCNEEYVILVLYFTTRNMVNDITQQYLCINHQIHSM